MIRSHFALLSVIFSIFIFNSVSLSYADDMPSRSDGYKDTAVFNGNQNMPVTLYGSAIEWDLDCLKGETGKCMRLAFALEVGEGDLEPEIRAALGYYLSACEKGGGAGCMRAASIIRDGSANFTNDTLTLETATRGCDTLREPDACVVKAIVMAAGSNPLDNAATEQMIENACARGSQYGCEIKAANLFYGRQDEASLTQAIGLFEDACKDNQAWGCAGLAEAYKDGIGVPVDNDRAMDAGLKGCTQGDGSTVSACAYYGYFLTQGGQRSNKRLGATLLSKSCLAGNAFACNATGEIGWKRPLGTGVAAWEVPLYFRDGCDLDNADACFNLAALYENGYGQMRPHSKVRMALIDKSCRLGRQEACNIVSGMRDFNVERLRRLRPPIDPSLPALQQLAVASKAVEENSDRKAYETVVRLRAEGIADANYLLGGWYYYGVMSAVNQEDGLILIENAARQRHTEAAKWVAMAYWYGDGVEMDRDKGLGYMEVAAVSGDNMARDIYRSMLAEPIRQDYARRQQEMEAEAERRKNDWAYQISLANARWSQAMTSSSASGSANQQRANAAWQRSQGALDKLNWNNAIGYSTGRTNACPMSNPYC